MSFYKTKTLGKLTHHLVREALADKNTTEVELRIAWPDIVGEVLAEHAAVSKLKFRKQGGNVLYLTVAPMMALEIQHQTATLKEKINFHMGGDLVSEIKVTQRPF